MTDTFITQCPHCQTSFRLQRSQLTAARGSVRCGACLQVFNAASQISSKPAQPIVQPNVSTLTVTPELIPDTAQPEATLSKAKKSNDAAAQPLMIHDDMDLGDLDDIDLDEELARLEREEQQRAREVSEAFANIPPSATPSIDPEADLPSGLSAIAEDDWSEELLAQEPVAQLSSVVAQDSASTTQAIEPTAVEPVTVAAPAKKTAADISIEPSIDHLRHLADEPLRLDWQPQKSPWRRWLAWGALNSLALLLLLGQYTYYNFNELARQDNTRPWLEKICPLIDCQLPSKVDVQKIKSSNLLVRSHPEFSGALLVDAIIYNRAAFTQPFPLLELNFMNQQGTAVARRVFKPAEYLGGELAGQAQMPPQTPIHIALEILEPSGGAASYTLDFVSPD